MDVSAQLTGLAQRIRTAGGKSLAMYLLPGWMSFTEDVFRKLDPSLKSLGISVLRRNFHDDSVEFSCQTQDGRSVQINSNLGPDIESWQAYVEWVDQRGRSDFDPLVAQVGMDGDPDQCAREIVEFLTRHVVSGK